MADLSHKEPKSTSKPTASDKTKDLSLEINRLKQMVKHESDLNSHLNSLQKDLHSQRLKSLREVSDKLKEDVWKYPTVQTLLGL
ncbi:unnamed protein product [Medioppia subpectinata]|uniref:Uncharacterized protein n=1 Tax=Medioppia subpectinata TaxID=1979941 RepID=A0A7R9KFX0_9ACAR|nr:unnamed protein product [Medioppia subpectinata]CAG2102615.1 unnamed protein product [Medioppia subpectinata]